MLRSVRGAVEALEPQDVELADEVIAFDDEIDARYPRSSRRSSSCSRARRPVASDLRLVLALLHVNLHLERMGDHCVTIAKLTKLVEGLDADHELLEGFSEMGVRAEEMIRVALDSFAARDVERGASRSSSSTS